MASWTGQLAPNNFDDESVYRSPQIANFVMPTPFDELSQVDDQNKVLVGVYTDNFPLSMPETARSGVRVPIYSDDYYHRFHFIPNAFVENVAADIIRTTTLWNAHFEEATCDSVSMDFPNEFSLDWPSGEPPFDLWELRTKTITINIPVDGLPTFYSEVDFDFGSLGIATFSLSVTRVITLFWIPMAPMRESLEWNTSILTGVDKTDEQRMALRLVPRQGFKFRIYLDTEQDIAKLKIRLHKWMKRLWAIPVWFEWEKHTGTLSAGASTVSIDTTDADWRDDSLGIVYQDENNWEILLIESVSATTLTLEDNLLNTYTGDKWIMPLRLCFPDRPAKINYWPNGPGYAEFSFLSNDNAAITTFGGSGMETHKGVTVLSQATYVPNSIEMNVDPKAIPSDYGTGRFSFLSHSEFNVVPQNHRFMNFTKAECWNFREWLHDLCGRRGTVYIPTFQSDIAMSRNLLSGDSTFYVENIGLTEYLGVNTMRRDLAFIFPDGSMICRRITNFIEVDASEETITLDTTVGQDIDIGECIVSFLDLYRLASDRVEVTWENYCENICNLSFTRIQH